MGRLSGFVLLLALLWPPGCTPGDPVPPPAPTTPASLPAGGAYVGDAACASCHPDIAAAYARTNKARSVARFDPAAAPERFDGTRVPHPASRLAYEAFVRQDTLYQRELRTDADGNVLHERAHAAAYVIGSGNATRSYLMEVNGYLTEMPLTWYVHAGRWDMSPGYAEANDRFERQINVACITCHNGPVTHTPFTQNHYTEVPTGITCERCHGPASRHVARWREAAPAEPGTPDPTIVNPAHLDRGGQLSTCLQCHLAGVLVFKPGEDPTTYRPGTPLAAHRTVFVPETELTDPEAVGIDSHPVRLAKSACYRQSAMTCTTCHDPHRPKALLPPDHYNRACLQCHDAGHEAICTRPEADAPARAASGNCVGCHMQQGGTTNVPHVVFTDHWIRRRPGPPRDPATARPAFDSPAPLRLTALLEADRSEHLLIPRTRRTPATDLETAIAYFDFYETMHRVPAYLDSVRLYARRGFRAGADHVEARIALGRALAEIDSLEAAARVLDDAARAYPEHAWVHFWHGAVLEARGREDAAIAAYERAVALQPKLIEAQVKLADALLKAGFKEQARSRLETVVRLDPVHRPKAWYNLGLLYLEARRPDDAAQAFAEAARLDPDLADAFIQLGSFHLARNELDEAAAQFYRAIVAAPDHPAGYGSLGLVYLQAGRPREARQMFEKVLELDPGNTHARAFLNRLSERR
ncbi:tetratricopeptide repeat protein [Rhodocaloribacter litoris]|uniref:tetratricopeptide repeat protein n=1 Tax=Rhodocaloribacter litoris TaxID=2558931 RepID=UPI00141EB87F|nr:tetratricopeptide repeat protein [Rhodocaloribacter litoris]QXD14876.1 tetratricopeptide repeat protein [Rhodocaloribacter litoris]